MPEKAANEILNFEKKPTGYYSESRLEMIQFIPHGVKKVLDAGCGEGFFAKEVKSLFKAEVWGLEIDMESARRAGNLLDKVLQGDISETIDKLPDSYFDCIVFNDVLEHLVNPYDILSRLKQKLSNEGVVVCSIPNVRYWRVFKKYVFSKQWKYEDNGIMDKTHLRFFTKKSIYQTFDNLGYKTLIMKGLKPTPSILFHILNVITLFFINDCKYLQYAFVTKPNIS